MPDSSRADAVADHRTRAITGRRDTGRRSRRARRRRAPGNAGYAVFVLGEFLELSAVENSDARMLRRRLEQNGFKIGLVDAMRGFRRRPPGVIALLAALTACQGRQ